MQMSQTAGAANYRISSIDALRGLVMVIMALDHTRELFHSAAFAGDPLDPQTTTGTLYFTRWLTHFCAPVFVFLSGTSIYLQSLRKTNQVLSRFLIKRGLWLIFAELIIVSFGVTFDIRFGMLILQVIWAIGISMVLLAGLIWLPFRWLVALGFVIVLGHNLLDVFEKDPNANLPFIYNLFHRQAFVPLPGGRILGIFYPFLPWTGVMILGYAFGRVYSTSGQEGATSRKAAFAIGGAAVALFLLLRAINVYGDPTPWTAQANAGRTMLSFLNTQKYPPSLLYLCMTLGPALLLLAYFNRLPAKVSDWLTVYGKVPFFYFVLHFYILHLLTSIFFLARGHSFREGLYGLPDFPFQFIIPGEGLALAGVYLVWVAVVIALYPACRWFGQYKREHKQWWLSYL